MKKKKHSSPSLSTLLVLLFVTLVFVVISVKFSNYYVKESRKDPHPQLPQQQQREFLAPKESNSEYSELQTSTNSGWKKYVNKKAKFSIEYPEKLQVYEESFSDQGGSLYICSHQVRPNYGNDCKEGMRIVYGLPFIDGKGGGCNPEDHQNLTVLGKNHEVCLTKDYLNLLYIEHPDKASELSIGAIFDKNFTEQEMRTSLKTLKFTR